MERIYPYMSHRIEDPYAIGLVVTSEEMDKGLEPGWEDLYGVRSVAAPVAERKKPGRPARLKHD